MYWCHIATIMYIVGARGICDLGREVLFWCFPILKVSYMFFSKCPIFFSVKSGNSDREIQRRKELLPIVRRKTIRTIQNISIFPLFLHIAFKIQGDS